MTQDKNFKQRVRAHAAAEGLSYTEALKELTTAKSETFLTLGRTRMGTYRHDLFPKDLSPHAYFHGARYSHRLDNHISYEERAAKGAWKFIRFDLLPEAQRGEPSAAFDRLLSEEATPRLVVIPDLEIHMRSDILFFARLQDAMWEWRSRQLAFFLFNSSDNLPTWYRFLKESFSYIYNFPGGQAYERKEPQTNMSELFALKYDEPFITGGNTQCWAFYPGKKEFSRLLFDFKAVMGFTAPPETDLVVDFNSGLAYGISLQQGNLDASNPDEGACHLAPLTAVVGKPGSGKTRFMRRSYLATLMHKSGPNQKSFMPYYLDFQASENPKSMKLPDCLNLFNDLPGPNSVVYLDGASLPRDSQSLLSFVTALKKLNDDNKRLTLKVVIAVQESEDWETLRDAGFVIEQV